MHKFMLSVDNSALKWLYSNQKVIKQHLCCICLLISVWSSEESLKEWALSIYDIDSWYGAQFSGLTADGLYPLSHHASPRGNQVL